MQSATGCMASYVKSEPLKSYSMAVSSAVAIAQMSGDEKRGDELVGKA